jgi:hypothetical protein
MRNLVRPLLAASVMALAALPAAPAAAQPFDKGSFHDVNTYTTDCGDLQLDTVEVVDGRFLGVQRGPDGLVYFLEVSTYTRTFTNPDTGKYFVQVVKGLVGKDQTITDNGDGTLTIDSLSPSRVVDYDSSGNVIGVADGVAVYRILIDDNGTPQDPTDDEFLDFLGIVKEVGHTTRPPLCDVARQYTT